MCRSEWCLPPTHSDLAHDFGQEGGGGGAERGGGGGGGAGGGGGDRGHHVAAVQDVKKQKSHSHLRQNAGYVICMLQLATLLLTCFSKCFSLGLLNLFDIINIFYFEKLDSVIFKKCAR